MRVTRDGDVGLEPIPNDSDSLLYSSSRIIVSVNTRMTRGESSRRTLPDTQEHRSRSDVLPASVRVLSIAEVLDAVMSFGRRGDQARCIRVCKAWRDICVPRIWRSLDGLPPLLRLLGEYDLREHPEHHCDRMLRKEVRERLYRSDRGCDERWNRWDGGKWIEVRHSGFMQMVMMY